MTHPQLGTKYVCGGCGIKFYDLGRVDPVCPKCGWTPEGESQPTKKKASKEKKAPFPVETAEEESIATSIEGTIDEAADDDEDEDDLGVEEVNLSEENAEALLGQIPSGDDDEVIGPSGNSSLNEIDDDDNFGADVGYGDDGNSDDDSESDEGEGV